MTQLQHWLSARRDASLGDSGDDELRIQGPWIDVALHGLTRGAKAAVRCLFSGGATEPELARVVLESEGVDALPAFYYVMRRVEGAGVVCRTIRNGDRPLSTAVPIGSRYHYLPVTLAANSAYLLSRFAYCHRGNQEMCLESPLSHTQLVLHGWQASALVHELATAPRACVDLARSVSGVSEEVVRAFVELALSTGFLTQVHEDGQAREDVAGVSQFWEFHDLLFHSRSRLGRHRNPYGGTFRFGDALAAPPALKPPMSDETIPLDKPDLERLRREDPPFTEILESRRSMRTYGSAPLSRAQLGEFLYRTARLKRILPSDRCELVERPYPAGGALHELELYPVVDRCDGLEAGLYHYRPADHALSRISARTEPVAQLLEQTWLTLNREAWPQVLIVITARFPRLSWKYQSVAYALILKHVGVLYQTMYLVATAMDLAPCALGGGDTDLFAAASGLDYLSEGAVGEFVLGTRPDTAG